MHIDLAKFKNVSANQIYNLMFGLSGDMIHLKHFGISSNVIKSSIKQKSNFIIKIVNCFFTLRWRFRRKLDSYRLRIIVEIIENEREMNFESATYGKEIIHTYNYQCINLKGKWLKFKLDLVSALFY
jgi:hypothetical protein